MDRYNFLASGNAIIVQDKCDNGAWVLYADAAARIAELQAELDCIREMDDKALKHWNEKIHKLEAELEISCSQHDRAELTSAKYFEEIQLLRGQLARYIDNREKWLSRISELGAHLADRDSRIAKLEAQLASERERNLEAQHRAALREKEQAAQIATLEQKFSATQDWVQFAPTTDQLP